jgi:hypothetical protein
MKYASHPRLVAALSRLAIDEGQAIDRALAGARNRHKGVHEARKAVRRLRALLSFGTEAFGAEGEALDRKLRALGRGLSSLRDAQVAVVTVHTLARRADGEHKPVWRALERVLGSRRKALMEKALLADPAFRRRRQRLASIGKLLEGLPWDTLDEAAVAAALDHSRHRVEKAEARAAERPTPSHVHRWRRRVRCLRMQLLAIEVLREQGLRIRGIHRERHALKRQTTLADRLGWKQDLQVLRSIVRAQADMPERVAVLSLLRERIQSEN